MEHQVHIIGGGLAGSEAAWQLAEAGVKVRLSEMRGGGDMTPAHQTEGLAELFTSLKLTHKLAAADAWCVPAFPPSPLPHLASSHREHRGL